MLKISYGEFAYAGARPQARPAPIRVGLALLLGLFAASAPAAAQEPTRVAVFDFELIDTSIEGEMGQQGGEAERLEALGAQLRQAFEADPRYEVVDLAPVEERARAQNLQACGGCDRKLAGEVSADWAVTGTVQKVSNLILNINLYVREVESGDSIQVMSADIRGNTDESWRRGLGWLIRNRLKLETQAAPK